MNTDQLLSWLRTDAYIGDATQWPDQTDAVLLEELTHKLWSVFEDIVVKARSGYWLKNIVTATTAGRARYRIPPRAVVGGLEDVEIAAIGGTVFAPLGEIPDADVSDWESTTPGTPQVFCVQGDQVVMYPTPNAAFPLRMSYYLRPSRLVPQRSAFPATIAGRVSNTAFLASLRQVTVNAIPVVYPDDGTAPATLTSGAELIDVIHPNGWHELAVVDAPQTYSGNVITIGGTADLSEIEVGDFVRGARQTDWPCLPEDFHRCLADVAAIKVAVELGLREKGDELAKNVESDLIRFRSLLLPRVKSEPKSTPISLKSRGGGGSRWLT